MGEAVMDRRFGFECELSAGAVDTLSILADQGLAPGGYLHSYHCWCDDCSYTSQWAIRGQEDCTADGELITKILTYGSDEADRTIAALADALQRARATTSEGVGFHVHVGREDMDNAAQMRLFRMFLKYQDDLNELASTAFRSVRDFNSPLVLRERGEVYNPDSGRYEYVTQADRFWTDDERNPYQYVAGSWLVAKDRTHEFRLWNATRVEWRMHLAVGLSVAMVNAAVAGVSVSKDSDVPLEFVLGDFLDDRTWAGIIRQRYHKGGLTDG